jgi:hypothetical protein
LIVSIEGCAPNHLPTDIARRVSVGISREQLEHELGRGEDLRTDAARAAQVGLPTTVTWVRWADDWAWRYRKLEVALEHDRVVYFEARGEEPPSTNVCRLWTGILGALGLFNCLWMVWLVYRQRNRQRLSASTLTPEIGEDANAPTTPTQVVEAPNQAPLESGDIEQRPVRVLVASFAVLMLLVLVLWWLSGSIGLLFGGAAFALLASAVVTGIGLSGNASRLMSGIFIGGMVLVVMMPLADYGRLDIMWTIVVAEIIFAMMLVALLAVGVSGWVRYFNGYASHSNHSGSACQELTAEHHRHARPT